MKAVLICVTLICISLVSSARAQDITDNEHYQQFKKWTVAAQHRRPVPRVFDWCVDAYDKMIASGVSPSTQVPEEIMSADVDFPRIEWKGTVKEINDRLCSGGQKKLNDEITAKHAPLKAALKADKLRLVINESSGTVYEYALAGGKYTGDAKALAAARVWFLDIGAPSNESQYCLNGGRRSSVRRYTFNAQHKLLSTTEKAYCGTPPASAYR